MQSIETLLTTPIDQRDPAWEDQFFMALSTTRLKLLSTEPQTGPDNWPYLFASTALDDSTGEEFSQVIHWLTTRGIGLVINPQKDYPDYVFTYGMVWNYRNTGRFFVRDTENIEPLGEIVHAGTPTESYLPVFARNILREFLQSQGLLQVRFVLVSSDRINYTLAFSLESMGNPPEEEHEGILEAVSWFLPPHYSLLLSSQKYLPETSLV